MLRNFIISKGVPLNPGRCCLNSTGFPIKTRIVAAAANIIVLTGAVIFVHSSAGLFGASQDMQFAIFVLFALVLLLWRGSGDFSMDKLVRPGPPRAET